MPDDLRLNTKGTVILGATASDPHVVPIFLAKLMLEGDGYQVRNLRCFNSADDFARAASCESDLKAVVIANNNGAASEDLADLRAAFDRRGVTAPVILGGHYWVGVTDSTGAQATLAAQGVTHFCNDMKQLLPLLTDLEEVPACTPLA